MDASEKKRNKIDYLFDIDFKKYYLILTQQKSFILIFCCSAMISSLALTYFFSEQYVAGTNIYYHPIETSVIQWKETQAFGSPAPSPPFKVIIQTLRSIIKSETLLAPVVQKLDLDKPVKKGDGMAWYAWLIDKTKTSVKEYGLKFWTILKYGRLIELEASDKAISKLRKNIEISATKESYVYLITVKDKFPQRAAAIVDEISADLVEWLKQRDVNTASSRIKPLEEQLLEKETVLENMMKQREAILKEKSLSQVADELSQIIKNFGELESSYILLQSEISGKHKTIENFESKLKQRTSERIHPEDIKKLESDKIFEEALLTGLIAKKVSMNASMKDLKARMAEMREVRRQIEYINIKIEAESREYMHLKDWYLENLSQSLMGDSEVELMHPAPIPAKPVQPIKIYHVGLTGLLGLFFSAGLVYIFAFFNIRVFFTSQGIRARNN